MKPPTTKQLIILEQIRNYLERNRYAPSIRELAAEVGVTSSSTMHAHLRSMRGKGLIQWEPERPRTLKIVEQ